MKKFILSLLAILSFAYGAKAADIEDVLNQSVTGVTGTSYTEFSGKSVSSDAVYAGQCAGGNSSIQLRSSNNNSGVVTTASGGKVTKIVVDWNENTANGRTLQVYGKNTAYTAASDLYDDTNKGDLLGTIVMGTNTELEVEGDYTFIGFRSAGSAMYLNSVTITWSTGSAASVAKPTLLASQSFIEPLTVTITSDNDVYYTVDGTDPTTESTKYTEPFTVEATTTVKAIAVDSENNVSSVASATYTKLEKMTIAEAQAAAAGTDVYIEGLVVANSDNGCVIYDGTDFIYAYAGSTGGNTFVLMNQVRGVGKVTAYGGANQLSTSDLTLLGEGSMEEPTPEVVTGADLDQYYADGVTPRKYATFIGQFTLSGSYYNFTVEGAENAVASIVPPMPDYAEEVQALDGKTVMVKGMMMYVRNKYVYFVATKVEELVTELANADFEESGESNAIGIRTYAKDIKGEEVATAQLFPGWSVGPNGDARAAGIYVYGSESFLGGEGYPAPPFSLFDGEEKALGLVAVWSASVQYTQKVYLEAGKYMLQVPVYNSKGGTTAFTKNLIGVDDTYSTATTYPVGEWTVENIEFELDAAKQVTVSLGYNAANSGSGAMPHLFIESAKIYTGEEAIDAAKTAAADAVAAYAAKQVKKDALDAINGYLAGDALFCYPQNAIDEAKAAVEAATTIEAIDAALATLNGQMNKPVADKAYAVENVDAGINMGVSTGAVKLTTDAAVYFTEVEGGWAISGIVEAEGENPAHSEYIIKKSGDTWSLSTSSNLEEAGKLIISPVEGGYTIGGLTQGKIFGTDNITDGSTVYCDKGLGNHGLWTIEEWTEPVYYTVAIAETTGGTVVAEPTEAKADAEVTVTVTPDEGFKLASINVTGVETNIAVELTETETGVTFIMPADNVSVNATFESDADPNVMTSLIENPAYLHKGDGGTADYAGWTWTPAPGESGWKYRNYDEPMNLVTYSGNVNFSFEQTIPEVPAGKYRLSVYGFYRAGEAQDEASRVAGGEPTHNIAMFAEVGGETFTKDIMNLYEGAADVDVTGKNNHCVVAGYEDLFVPGGADDSRAFYIAGYYRNDLEINVTEAGEVKIGINHPEGRTYDGDYAPIGAWELYRLGDAEINDGSKTYEGKIASGLAMAADPYTMVADAVADQTVKIADAEADGQVNITFSGYAFPMLPLNTGEFTVLAEKTVNGDGSIEYSAESFPMSVTNGMMDINYTGKLTGTQASADATPTLIVTLSQASICTSVFGATEEEAKEVLAQQYVEPVPELESGIYYVRNVATGKYFGPGNNWGTHASIIDEQVYNTFTKMEDGAYTMETMVSNGGNAYFNEGEWMDNGNAVHYTISPVGDGYWTIAKNGQYYIATDNTVLAPTTVNDVDTNDKAWWQFLTQEEIDAENAATLATATADNPVDATFLVKDYGFGRNRRDASTVWNPTGANLTLGGPNSDVGNYVAESYRSSNGFSIKQTIENAPKGVYKLVVQGFYRQDGSDNENLPVIYMNDETVQIPLRTGTENDMTSAGNAFNEGKYAIDPVFVQLDEAGTIELGARLENNNMLWVIFDNFKLTYFGPDANLEDVVFGDLIAQVEELRQLAEEQKADDNVSPATKTALDEALAATETIDPKTVENYQAAIATLTTPTEKAKSDVNYKKAIDGMYKLMESTNVYTQEAYDTYKAKADAYLAAWEEGTLTEAVVNPYDLNGWHNTALDYDDFILSAWTDKDGYAINNYDKDLYINTWSTEGQGDGSNFLVPFFEYWTGNDNSLGANTWTATVTGLDPDTEYTVTAWTRVRLKNPAASETPTGINFQVGEADPVSVENLEQIGSSQFWIGTLTVTAKPDADGNLTISYVIDESNNISWLSYQNVKYEGPEMIVVNEEQVPVIGTVDVPVEVIEKTPYSGDTAQFDTADVLAFFPEGTTMADLTVMWLNPDGTTVTPEYGGGTIDGWRDAEGNAANWGATHGVCVKLQDPASGTFDYIGAIDASYVAGDTYQARFAFVKDGKAVAVNVNISFVAPSEVEIEIGDVVATASVSYTKEDVDNDTYGYPEKVVTLTDADVQSILTALGLSSLSEAKVYGYNPTTKELVENYGPFDGWRDANGDFHNWSGDFAETPACLKYTDGINYYAYAHPYGDTYQTGSYKLYWAFATDTKAVLVEFEFSYVEEADGINGIFTEAGLKNALENGNVFDLSGRKVSNVVKGSVYIVNGKKLMVK